MATTTPVLPRSPRTRSQAHRPAPPRAVHGAAPSVEVVGTTDATPSTVEHVLGATPPGAADLTHVGARADVVRILPSAAVPTVADVRALVQAVEDAVAAAGRSRREVRVVLEVETVVAADLADARRRRSNLAYAEAFVGLTWSPSASWVVAPVDRVRHEASDLARRTGVDVVALRLVGPSAVHAPVLTAG